MKKINNTKISVTTHQRKKILFFSSNNLRECALYLELRNCR